MNRQSKKSPIGWEKILVISLFFLWALTSNLLPVLIPHLKQAAQVNTFQASLVDSAYWIAYFLLAIPAGFVMKRFGYRNTIVAGLLLAAAGAFLFPWAADAKQYEYFLFALFIVASGMTFLEVSANPYIRELGPPETYSQRLNFAQAFNGLGAVVATNFLNHLILSDELVKTDIELKHISPELLNNYYTNLFSSVKLPYVIIGIVLLIFALIFIVTRFDQTNRKKLAGSGLFNPFQYPALSWSMLAQFFYVGAQVCISSFFILYAQNIAGFSINASNYLLGLLLVAFMIGRYVGAILMKKYEALNLLIVYALINLLLCAVIVFVRGRAGVYAFIGVEFFMSIMYPTIFSLGIKSMKDKTEIASSYMVMMIIGGALLPPILGIISDSFGSIAWGYMVPLICFAVIGVYGIVQRKSFLTTLLHSQRMQFEQANTTEN
jgi:MFS transporter, FHS family, L-fucose permease